jgi:hypothetical protein
LRSIAPPAAWAAPPHNQTQQRPGHVRLQAATQNVPAVSCSASLDVRAAQHQPLFRAFAASADFRSRAWLAAFSAE